MSTETIAVAVALGMSAAALYFALSAVLYAGGERKRPDEVEEDAQRKSAREGDHSEPACKCGAPLLDDGSCAGWWAERGRPPLTGSKRR